MLTNHTQIEGLDLIDFLSYKDHVYLRARNFRGESLTVPSILMLLDQTSLKVEAIDEHLAIHCLEQNTNLKPKSSHGAEEHIYTHRKLKYFETEFPQDKYVNSGPKQGGAEITFKPYEMKCLRLTFKE